MISTLLVISSVSSVKTVEGGDYFFNLRILALGGQSNPDYGLFIMQQLREINVDSNIIVHSGWPNWLDCLSLIDDWDMAIISAGEISSPDMRAYYTENGSRNIFRLNSDIPYNNESEELQNLAVITTDLDVRWQLQLDWQNLFMDKLLPLLPLFAPREYEAVWTNTMGYEARWGIADSLPYMYYDGLHQGQQNLKQFNMAIPSWNGINPLSLYTKTEDLLVNLIFEPLLTFSPDLAPLKTGIIQDWTMVDDNHYLFELRDNIYWNPSYNVSQRNVSSLPLSSISEEDLLIGLKVEFSNGTNQKVTAKDAVFSLLAFSNPNITAKADEYSWLSNCYVDLVDDSKFHVLIDGDLSTPEKEVYVDFWTKIPVPLLPEFFLNSTNLEICKTSGGHEYVGLYPEILESIEWITYQTSAFGCGKYMLDYYAPNSIGVFQKSPYWFEIGAIDGAPQNLDFETINIHLLPDTSVVLDEFLDGNLDWVSLTTLPTQRKLMQADPRFDVQTHVVYLMNFIAFNLGRHVIGGGNNQVWLNEPGKTNCTKALAIRKAICYAIDRDEMNDELHDGEYLINNRPNPLVYSWVWPPIDVIYNLDLDRAWEWMEAAGYEKPYTPTPTPTPTLTSTIPVMTTINFPEVLVLFGFILIIFNQRKRKRKKNYD